MYVFLYLLFELFGTHNRHYSSTLTSFLYHLLHVVFFCQIILELKFRCQAIRTTGCTTDRSVR